MQKLFMFMLAAVSSALQFGKDGGVWLWDAVNTRFKATKSDGSLSTIEAAPAVEGSEVVTLAQLNSNLVKTKGGIIVSGAITATTDLPTLEGEVRISAITAGGFTQGVLYIGVDNAGVLEWTPLALVDGQLATFGISQELSDGADGFIYQYFDTHTYIWDATTSKFLDNGALMDTKLTDSVKKQFLSFTHTGLANATFAKEIPLGAMITNVAIHIQTAFNKEFETETVTINDGATVIVDDSMTKFGVAGIYDHKMLHAVAGEVNVNFTDGAVTTGTGVVEITYVLPA